MKGMTHSDASRNVLARRLALTAAIVLVALTGRPVRAAAVLTVMNGSDSVASPAPGSLRAVLAAAQPGDTVRFAQNFSITFDPTTPHSSIDLGRALTGLTIEGPAELRGGVLIVRGNGATITGMRFADFKVFAGSSANFDDGVLTDGFVLRGNTLVGDAEFGLVLTRNAVVENNTFDVRAPKGDNVVSDFASENSRWAGNTWTATSTGGFHESECRGFIFEGANSVVGDAIFQTRSGRISGNTVTGNLRAYHSDFAIDGTLTIEKNTCATLGASRPGVEVFENVVTGVTSGSGKPKPFPITVTSPTGAVKPGAVREKRASPFSVTMAQVTGDTGFVRVRGNKVTATDGWLVGAMIGATALATECLVEANEIEGGTNRGLQITTAKSAVVKLNTVTSGGKLGALAILGEAPDGLTIDENTIDGGAGPGIAIAKGAGTATLTKNTVSGCRAAALDVTGRRIVSEDGTYTDCGSGVLVGKKTGAVVRGGSITGNRGTGLYADIGSTVEIVRTSFSGNGGAGIDLAPGGVTSNSKRRKANGNVPFPDNLTYDDATGRVIGKAEPLARIDAFGVETGSRAGNPKNGEGVTWLGETFAGANGDFAFPPTGRVACPPSKRITFTATRLVPGAVPANVTSEFSDDVVCGVSSPLLLVDRAVDGTAGNLSTSSGVLGARYSTISEDGRFVVFTSRATNLVPDDTNGVIDVFVRDTTLGTTTRVNRTPAGGEVVYEFSPQPDAGSAPSISADGRFVCYTSRAEGSFRPGTWYFNDPGVILYDTQTGTNTIVASPEQLPDPLPSGSHSYGGVYYASMSGDASAVIFTARGEDYVTGDAGDDNDAFVWTRATGAYERVSVPTGGGDVTNGWQESNLTTPRLSHDARFAVFASTAVLSGTTIPYAMRPWIRDRQSGTTEAVCVDSAGAIRSGYDPWSSDDGRFVVFYSTESLVPADTNAFADVYLRDRQTGTTSLVSAKADGTVFYGDSLDPTISGDGRFIAFRNFGDIWLLDRDDGTKEIVSGSPTVRPTSGCHQPRISRTGQFVQFETDATNLADLGGQSFVRHTYLRDLAATGD